MVVTNILRNRHWCLLVCVALELSKACGSDDDAKSSSNEGAETDKDAAAETPLDVGTEVASFVWATSAGGNGHRYALRQVDGGLTWSQAVSAAQSLDSYLATLTNSEENATVFALATQLDWPVTNGSAQGPWLGASVVGGLWAWSTDELWSYTAFDAAVATDWSQTADNGEGLLYGGSGSTPAATWASVASDIRNTLYLVEAGEPSEADEQPEPAAVYVPDGCSNAIELIPADVGSADADTFSTLPTSNPALFGIEGDDIRAANFDTDAEGNTIPAGTHMSNEYAALGLTMNNITARADAFEGAASAPNVAWIDTPQIFTFNVPVTAVGLINTSPDEDILELWTGPNRTGQLLLRFSDAPPGVYTRDRFVGATVCAGQTIGSLAVYNELGDLELDELIFQVSQD